MDHHRPLPALPARERSAGTTWGLGVVSLSVLSTFTLLLALALYGAGRNLWLLAFLVLPIGFLAAALLAGARARQNGFAEPRRR